jgi:ADP-ribose pyrophosphatase YjhB (NUDIX family)
MPKKVTLKHHHHLGVYGVIFNKQGDMLLIEKSRGPYKGLLDLPGGSMEDGELLEDTLTREIAEETSCTVKKSTQLGAVSFTTPYEKEGEARLFRHVAILYSCTVSGTPSEYADGEDSEGARWIRLTPTMRKMASPLVKAALKLAAQQAKKQPA